MPDLVCNVCDQSLQAAAVADHISSRNHSVRKKVAQFNESNVQFRPSYQGDTSIAKAWIRDLYKYDFLSSGVP